MEDNCFTMLCWFLPHNMNQPYTSLLPLEPLSHFLLHPNPLGHHWASGWAPCVIQQFPTSYLLYTWFSSVVQSCLTLCGPVDCSPPGSSIYGFLQARVLEWVAISFSRGSSRSRDRTPVSRIVGRHFTLWATREVQLTLLSVFKKKNKAKGENKTEVKSQGKISLRGHAMLIISEPEV